MSQFQIIRKDAALALTDALDEMEVIASDETIDRYGDIIRADGWNLEHYQKNPVVLFAHDTHSPVGTATRVWRDGTRLCARIKLATQGTSELIDALRSLVAQKIIRAISVGFMPTKEPKRIRDAEDHVTGFEFIGQELLEMSLVAVGANPEALALAKSLNLSAEVMQRTFAALPGGAPFRTRARVDLDRQRLRACSRTVVTRS